tara:strand:- start:376 stop:984 length:609 start_codon:yes stop_codon:yes gene_type:complete
MLYVIKPEKKQSLDISFEDILDHRLDFARSEGLTIHLDETGHDDLDTQDTTYLAYKDPVHGLIGSARLLPKESLPSDLKCELPDQSIPFVLADCLFHLPESRYFEKYSSDVAQSHFSHLVQTFYVSIAIYLENRAIQDQTPYIYFRLSEEDFDFMSRYLKREMYVLKEIQTPSEFENAYLGAFDFSDLIYSSCDQKGDFAGI